LSLEPTGANSALLRLSNRDPQHALTVRVRDLAYGNGRQTIHLGPTESVEMPLELSSSYGWYDLGIRVRGSSDFEQRYAGHIEAGVESCSDPFMGRV
jgi:phospholipase C